MIVAIPLGLMSAIYLTQYAKPGVRRLLKPMLEILAGVPTVVYGYFAALTVAPAIREFAVSIRSEEHTSELQSLMRISYAVFCLQKKTRYCDTDRTSKERTANTQCKDLR